MAESIDEITREYVDSEGPADEDKLDIPMYVKGLAEFIQDCPTPMTIALQGGWGSGKTTLFNLVKKQIKRTDENPGGTCGIVELNTWQASVAGFDGALASILIHKIAEAISDKGLKDKAKGLVPSLWSGAKKLLPSGIEAKWGSGRFADLGEYILAYFDGDTSTKRYDELSKLKDDLKESVGKYLEDQKLNRLVIFVDDLDRLEPREAVNLLEGIKNFMDCEGCVFVLALDEDVVFAGVREKYGSNAAVDYSKRFFDKIIQVPFSMPVASYNVRTYLKSLLEGEEAKSTPEGGKAQGESSANAYDELVEGLAGVIEAMGSGMHFSESKNPRSIKRSIYMRKLYKGILDQTEPKISWNVERESSLLGLLILREHDKDAFNALCAFFAADNLNLDESQVRGLLNDSSADEASGDSGHLDLLLDWRRAGGENRQSAFDEVAWKLSSVLEEPEYGLSIGQCVDAWAKEDDWWQLHVNKSVGYICTKLQEKGYLTGDFNNGWLLTREGKRLGLISWDYGNGHPGVRISSKAQAAGSKFQQVLQGIIGEA